MRYLIEHFLRTFLRCTCWQLNHGHKYALVLIWQEGAWQTHEQIGHADHDDQIQHQVTPRTAQNTAYAVGVVVRALLEHAVKPAEEAFLPSRDRLWQSVSAWWHKEPESGSTLPVPTAPLLKQW